MSKVVVTEATYEDALELAGSLRDADLAEVQAVTNRDINLVLRDSLRCSTMAWSARVDGELMCMFGVGSSSLVSRQGMPWLLGTPLIEKHSRQFIRHTGTYMRKVKTLYPNLTNYVDARNTKSINWLKRLGFNILPAEPWGVAQIPFHRFEMRG